MRPSRRKDPRKKWSLSLALPAPRVQLLDFGLAAEVRSSMSRVSMRGHAGTSGTPAYMAPEQWDAMRQSAATDQYALAAMAYQMLAGYLPFDADDTDLLRRAVLSRPPQPVKGLPGTANAALVRALAKAPEARFPSCTAFVEALARAFDPRGGRRLRRIAAAFAAVLLAGVAGVIFTQSRRAAEGGASRPGEPQGGGGLPSAVAERKAAQGGASRRGEADSSPPWERTAVWRPPPLWPAPARRSASGRRRSPCAGVRPVRSRWVRLPARRAATMTKPSTA